jgi:hypothetical protein
MKTELIIFKYDLRQIGLPADDIDGSESYALFEDREELDWYVIEVLEPLQLRAFIRLVSASWYPVGTVSRWDCDLDDDDLYREQYYSARFARYDDEKYRY